MRMCPTSCSSTKERRCKDIDVRNPSKQTVKCLVAGPLDPRLLALLAYRVNHLVSLAPLCDECWQHFRRILQVRIHDRDGIAARKIKPGGDGHLMAKVARQLDHDDALVLAFELRQSDAGFVTAAIVDKEDLEVDALRFEDSHEPGIQYRNIFFFIVNRNDDG